MNDKLWTTDFWETVGTKIGPSLASSIYTYFQYAQIAIICLTVIAAAITFLIQGCAVWFGSNEDSKKRLKLACTKALHAIGYTFVGLVFVQIVWNVIVPVILSNVLPNK